MNSFFQKTRDVGKAITGASRVAKVSVDAVNMARQAFNLDGNQPNNYGNQQQESFPTQHYYDDDAINDTQLKDLEVEPTPQDKKNFRKKAEIKAKIIVGTIKSSYLWKRILAKLIITNKGDDEIALRHKDLSESQIKELPKDVQLILRNQKHVQSIDNIKVSDDLMEAAVDYYAFEFEEQYRRGEYIDYSGIDPIKLIIQEHNAPFNELIGDLILDFGLNKKEALIEIGTKFYQKISEKYLDKPQLSEEEAREVVTELVDNELKAETETSAEVVSDPGIINEGTIEPENPNKEEDGKENHGNPDQE